MKYLRKYFQVQLYFVGLSRGRELKCLCLHCAAALNAVGLSRGRELKYHEQRSPSPVLLVGLSRGRELKFFQYVVSDWYCMSASHEVVS